MACPALSGTGELTPTLQMLGLIIGDIPAGALVSPNGIMSHLKEL